MINIKKSKFITEINEKRTLFKIYNGIDDRMAEDLFNRSCKSFV